MKAPTRYLALLFVFITACSPRSESTSDTITPSGTLTFIHLNDTYRIDHVNAVRQSRFDWLGDNWRLLTGEADVDQRLHDRFVIEFGDKKIGIFALTAHFDDGGNDRDYAPVDKN